METYRRNFLRQTTLTTAGIGLASTFPSFAQSGCFAPSDKINVALVGCRNMGFGILKHHLSNTDVNCVAVCDIIDVVLDEKA
jgi:NADH/NAD ratio-sensing transcriptional regulator Rex